MRQKLFLLLLLFIIPLSLFGQSKDTLSYAEISGQINYYEGIPPYDSVSVMVSEFGTFNHFYINKAIEKNGRFQLKFPINRPQEIHFFFGDNGINFPFAPNYKATFILDNRDFINANYQPIKIKAKGDNQLTINYIIQFLHFYFTKFHDSFFKENQRKQMELDGKEYGIHRLKIFDEHQYFLKEFIKENKIEDTLFIQWAENTIRYELINDLHDFLYKKYDMLNDMPPDFYRQLILDNQQLNQKGAIFSRYYLMGLHYEMLYLNGEFQKSPVGKQLLKEGKPLWEGKLNHLLQHSNGFAKDVMLSEYLDNNIANPKVRSLAKKYLDLIQDDIIKNNLQKKL